MKKGENLPRPGRRATPGLPKKQGGKEKLVEQTLAFQSFRSEPILIKLQKKLPIWGVY